MELDFYFYRSELCLNVRLKILKYRIKLTKGGIQNGKKTLKIQH